ncbi:MAG: acyclic terpene utilization AtuA family protein [Gemmatimonadota bacterium]
MDSRDDAATPHTDDPLAWRPPPETGAPSFEAGAGAGAAVLDAPEEDGLDPETETAREADTDPAEKVIRIGSGQGFWGDWQEAPKLQVRTGAIDYLMLDYLAEITMSIMQKQRDRSPEAGYARDFVQLMKDLAPDLIDRGVRVVSNAGGVNPVGCREALRLALSGVELARPIRVAVVRGDDILGDLDELIASGHELRHMETGEPLSTVRDRVASANAYLGAEPIVRALEQGADIVITGRSTDTALTYAPLIHEFGWAVDDWDLMASGVVAGHINECGSQAAGGNSLVDWRQIDLIVPGYPIIEARGDGTFVVTKHAALGGRVTWATVTEQLVYEMGDPEEYITPDVVADFSTISLQDLGEDRVRVSGVKGRQRTDKLKVSIAYHDGYKAIGTLTYAWPDAVEKAQRADEILRGRLKYLGYEYDEIRTEFIGAGACHGPLAGPPLEDLPEVTLRVGVRDADRATVAAFTREMAPLILAGPPTVTGFAGGRPRVQDVVAYWPALLDRGVVESGVTVETVEL